jgi:hypothetical protein
MKGKMKLEKNMIINLIIVALTFFILKPGYAQMKGNQAIIFPGVLEQISADSEFIVVNEAKILLSSNLKIMDEAGTSLTLYDLKRGSSVTLEVVKHGSGFLAKKIIVKAQKR